MRRLRLCSSLYDGCHVARPGIWLLAVALSGAAFAPRAHAGVAPVGRTASSAAALVWPADPIEGPSLFAPTRGSAVVYIPPANDAPSTPPAIAPARVVDTTSGAAETDRSDGGLAGVVADADRGVILVPLP